MQSVIFIEKLLKQTHQIIAQAEKLQQYELSILTWKEDKHSWSILECLEHLNLYGHFYLPQIENKIQNAVPSNETEFKSGMLGGYFAKSMLPKKGFNKMKTFKDKNPLNANLDKTVIDEFIGQQNQLIFLLQQSKTISLNTVKIQTSISRLIQLKLGDTFQFLINHIIRHLNQTERIKTALSQQKEIPFILK